MNNSDMVVAIPMNKLLVEIGEPALPEDHPAKDVSMSQAWGFRYLMPENDVIKLGRIIAALEGMRLIDLKNLKLDQEHGNLTEEGRRKIDCIKNIMQS